MVGRSPCQSAALGKEHGAGLKFPKPVCNITLSMYSIDSKDAVVQISDVPQSSVGAPCPMILAGEYHLRLAYYIQERPSDWDGKTVRLVGENTSGEPVALIAFTRPYAHMFGPPNDEAFNGHPLSSRGLKPYRVYKITDSSWLRGLQQMNAVHPYHRREHFAKYHHFIFAFHDTTFECIAETFQATAHRGSVHDILEKAFKEMRE
jgi:hypothetical protein